jgi:hypothetical protein
VSSLVISEASVIPSDRRLVWVAKNNSSSIVGAKSGLNIVSSI